MATFDRELKLFEMELNKNFKKLFKYNRSRMPFYYLKNIKKRSQAPNEIVLGSEFLDVNNQSDLHYNGVDMQSVGTVIPYPNDYSDMELNKYFNFDSNVGANPSKEDLETRRNQSLDDFFQDFNEIISSEMKTTITPFDQGHHSAATNMIPYSDQSNTFNSTVSGVEFNLDLTQFYINTNESDFLTSDELKPDFPNGMIHFPPSQFSGTSYPDKVGDDQLEFPVMNQSNMHGNGENYSISQGEVIDDQIQFSVTDRPHQSKQMAEYLDENNTKISVSTPMNQFYLDFKVNGEGATASNEDHSVVTYISKDSLQSVEYINERGQTETVVYVDQQPDGTDVDKTQYEIINFDEYQYHTENVDSQHNSNDGLVEMTVSNGAQVPYYSENLDGGQQTDILSTLLSDKNNKIVIIAKPLKNPKVRRSNDEFYMKFEEIDNNPTNIPFAKPPKVKGCRKQKIETINQIESDFVEPKRSQPKVCKMITATTTVIAETPKLPSKFMKDRRNKMEASRKRPRKLFWDSERDYEMKKKFNQKLNI